jgi:hypothetical protein
MAQFTISVILGFHRPQYKQQSMTLLGQQSPFVLEFFQANTICVFSPVFPIKSDYAI